MNQKKNWPIWFCYDVNLSTDFVIGFFFEKMNIICFSCVDLMDLLGKPFFLFLHNESTKWTKRVFINTLKMVLKGAEKENNNSSNTTKHTYIWRRKKSNLKLQRCISFGVCVYVCGVNYWFWRNKKHEFHTMKYVNITRLCKLYLSSLTTIFGTNIRTLQLFLLLLAFGHFIGIMT